MMAMQKKPNKKQQIAILLNTGRSDPEIAEMVGTTVDYVWCVRYTLGSPEAMQRRRVTSNKRYHAIAADPERRALVNEQKRKRYHARMKDREYRRTYAAKIFQRRLRRLQAKQAAKH